MQFRLADRCPVYRGRGAKCREEINLQPGNSSGGENYGWRVREGTSGNALPGAIDPIYNYTHGAGANQGFSITGGYVYRGPLAALQGRYFFADYVTNRIWSLNWDHSLPNAHNGTNFTDFIDWSEKITTDVGSISSVSSFAEDASGNLYVIDLAGEIFRITGASVPTLAEGQKLLDGVVAAGNISSLAESDDQYQQVDPSPTTNPAKQKVDMIVITTAKSQNPQGLSFRLEAKKVGGPVGDVLQQTQMFNQQTNQWEILDVRPVANVDERITLELDGDLTRFVHPATREVIANVTWLVEGFTGSPFLWSIDIDEAVWPQTE